jgi:peroxiredoxin
MSFSRKNVALEKENERLAEYAAAEPGDAVPPIESIDLEGQRANVSYGGSQKHLLFIFTSHCSICAEQLPVWSRIADEISADGCQVHLVSIDDADETKAHLGGRYQNLPVVVAPSPMNLVRTYRVSGFPQVMLISGQGVVEWVQTGRLPDEKIQELISKVKGRKS